MKKRGGGKAKGAAFERDICRRLSLWYTNGKQDDVFWRSAISGGRATTSGRTTYFYHSKGKRPRIGRREAKELPHVAGDVCAVHPEGFKFVDEWFVECKHVRDLQLHRFLIAQGKLWVFWIQACTQAEQHHKLPMLIARQSGGFPELLLLDIAGWAKLRKEGKLQYARAVIDESTFVCMLSDLLGARNGAKTRSK